MSGTAPAATIGTTLQELRSSGVEASGEPGSGFGVGTTIVLPGGARMLLYEPRHPSAPESR